MHGCALPYPSVIFVDVDVLVRKRSQDMEISWNWDCPYKPIRNDVCGLSIALVWCLTVIHLPNGVNIMERHYKIPISQRFQRIKLFGIVSNLKGTKLPNIHCIGTGYWGHPSSIILFIPFRRNRLFADVKDDWKDDIIRRAQVWVNQILFVEVANCIIVDI